MTDKPNMPEKVFVYSRNGRLEIREESIVVGNTEYIRADLVTTKLEAAEAMARALDKIIKYRPDGFDFSWKDVAFRKEEIAKESLQNYRSLSEG